MKKPYIYRTINGKKERLHRHVIEEAIGRLLAENEHVYHINGDAQDNCIENLIVITKNIKEKK
jgi:hypothetical protein